MKKIKKIGLFLLLSVNCYAQINALDIKSAQSYEMERYGNIPINLNTGGLDLSIPIFESNIPGTDKNFSIGLNYNSSGFIPAKKSNYVGSNWFLNFGGAITREVKGIPDDRDREGAIKGFLIGLRKYSKTNADIYTGNFVQGRQDKYQGTIDILGNGYGGFAELESDKYNFNFMGKSGYFYIGNNGTPLLFSNDNNMKIDILGISGQTNNICSPNVSQIKITDGEGNVYYFGGEAENLEVHYEITRAGEIQTPMKLGTDALYHITAWGLRKVVFTNGREINFYYKTNSGLSINNFCSYRGLWNPGIIGTPLEPLFDLNISMNEVKTRYSGSANVNWGGYHMWGENSGFSHNYDVYINLVKKIIPERIAADSFEILFDYQIYDKAADKDHKSYKLSNIKINNKNSEISNIDFDYYRNGFYFFLKDLNINNKLYSFDYHKREMILPTPYTYGVDFLGYWNGGGETTNRLIPEYGLNHDTGDYNLIGTSRNPSSTLFDATLLKSVTYPTKGYSEFIYEPHEYSKKLDRNSTSQFLPVLINQPGTIGGARIQKVIDFDGTNSSTREYKYLKDFQPNFQNSGSSGISNSYIRFFELLNYKIAGPGTIRRRLLTETANNMVPSTYSDSPINYTEVTELLNNRFNKKFLFSGLDTVTDTITVRKTYFYSAESSSTYNFYPLNLAENINVKSNNQEVHRNKLLKTVFYKDNQVVKDIENKYTKLLSSYKYTDYYTSSVQPNYAWVNFYKEYVYPSLPSSTITTDYINGNQLQTKTEYYYTDYDHNNLTKQKIITPNTTYETSYQYAYEIINTYLIGKNVLNIPLATEEKKNGITISKTLTNYPRSETTAKARIINNTENKHFPLPFDFSKDLIINLTEKQITYDFYDDRGNIVQYTTKTGIPTSIIWGYNQTQPIAKVEGATYAQVSSLATALIDASNIDAAAAPRTDETTFLTALDTFRKAYPNFQITTYSYDPLIGVRSITPPSGIRELYIYDTANRLMEIRDINGNILKEFEYKYKQ